jgi:hypothetical protein
MRRNFRGKMVSIEVQNPAGVCRSVRSLAVDGQPVEGDIVPTARLKSGSKIVAILG